MSPRKLLLASLVTAALADYDSFYFSSNITNWLCDGMNFVCTPPATCAHEALTDKYYCCEPGADSVCWTGNTRCSGRNSETGGSGQTDCGSYCCLGDRERCTQRQGQINICWATAANPFAGVSDTRMNDTFSSISSSRPTAASFTFSIAAVTASSSSSSSSRSASSTSTGSSTAAFSSTSSTSSPTATDNSNSGSRAPSGRATGGIVVAVVGGLVLIAAAAFFIIRSRRGQKATPVQDPSLSSAYAEKHQYSDVAHRPPPQTPMAEMDAGPQSPPVQEWYRPAVEIDSNTPGEQSATHSAELPGSR